MSAQRFFVIGAGGQLGRCLLHTAGDRTAVPLTSSGIDITDRGSATAALADLRAGDVVLNAAAYTAVDAAESDRDAAFAVNRDGPRNLAAVVRNADARLVHVSTDYVFAAPMLADGEPRPFEPDDATGSPTTVYGASKLAGEDAVRETDPTAVVVRTAWVFTGGSADTDFVATMARLEGERDTLTVVDDQTGSPTYAPDLAAGLWEVADRLTEPALRRGAVLHATNAGHTTWYGLARAVFSELGADPERVTPCATADFRRPAARPSYSVLSDRSWRAAGLSPLRDWRDAVHAAVTARTGRGGVLG